MKHRSTILAAVVILCTGVVRGAAPAPAEKYVTYAMTRAGDAERGKALFFDEQRLGCSRCHAVDGKGAKVGPNLFAIGDKFGRRELVESVVSPSATIAEDYGTMIVTTAEGDVIDGIVKESAADHVALVGADGQVTRLEARDIKDRRASLVSMMPEGLQNGLSFAEFDDLIEYLASLKTAETIASTVHGMPATIPETATPVVLRAIHLPEHHFSHPVWFGPVPGVAGAFAVVEHETGKVWLLEKLGEAGETKSVFFDNAPAMRGAHGIMSIVFHPRYAENRKYYLVRQPVERGMFYTEILEGIATQDLRADSGQPLRQILTIDASSANHPGGGLEFGPDGYLYIGMGDTGPQQDPHGNAQAMNLLRGKMLRIDVDHAEGGKAYAVPTDNPFVGRAGVRPEIWAAGLREPWRYSFDPVTGELWVGDVGQDLYEEVDVVTKGENYGWNVIEGFAPFSNQYRRQGERFAPPVFAYGRKYGVSVTGGYVYRGDRASELYGAYIFGDFQSRRIFALTREGTELKTVRQIGLAPQRIVSFSRGPAGELYLVGYEGTIYRMELERASLK
jgi:putative heme-binding domain-containing protein